MSHPAIKLITAFLASSLTMHAFAMEKNLKSDDEFENWNRAVYKMNDTLDRAILKPITKGYMYITPKIVQKGVHNFFSNLRLIPSFINDVLQGNIKQAASDGWRFTINSTIGIAGIGDVATYMDLPEHSSDFGLTLAKWGYTNSSYFVIPFWGPSTIRDGISLVPYYFMTVYAYIDTPAYWYGAVALDFIDQRAQYLKLDDVAKEAALDPYAFQRNAYLQHRAAQIAAAKGVEPQQSFDDEFDAELDEPDTTQNSKS